ncbi:MAG TPA: hypothetical protein VJR89_27060, partial [Polyangiales bacterium]|nr:hypothetical protein [Polyangiales bacterium]
VLGRARALCCWMVLIVGTASAQAPAAVGGVAAPPLRELQKTSQEWRAIFAAIPQLAAYARDFTPLGAAATREALRASRNRAGMAAWTFVDGPFWWLPEGGKGLWIVTGAASGRVVIAVLEPGEKPKHLASAVLVEPSAALAVGYSASEPKRLLFTTCYGGAGLSGAIDVDAGGVEFSYR